MLAGTAVVIAVAVYLVFNSQSYAFLKDLLSFATLQIDVPKIFTLERDPKDEIYINLALFTGATYVVSRDNDLLDLMDEQKPGGKEFIAHLDHLSTQLANSA